MVPIDHVGKQVCNFLSGKAPDVAEPAIGNVCLLKDVNIFRVVVFYVSLPIPSYLL